MTDLDKLIERVESGTVKGNGHQEPFASILLSPLRGAITIFASAYGGSVDAALALKDELLGDMWALEMTYRPFGCNPHLTFVTLTKDHTGYGNGTYSRGHNESTARAILIATLKAYKWEKW